MPWCASEYVPILFQQIQSSVEFVNSQEAMQTKPNQYQPTTNIGYTIYEEKLKIFFLSSQIFQDFQRDLPSSFFYEHSVL